MMGRPADASSRQKIPAGGETATAIPTASITAQSTIEHPQSNAPPAASNTLQEDGLSSPGATADENHLGPYAHLSDRPSDTAYDSFSDYDDYVDLAGLPPMQPMNNDQDDTSFPQAYSAGLGSNTATEDLSSGIEENDEAAAFEKFINLDGPGQDLQHAKTDTGEHPKILQNVNSVGPSATAARPTTPETSHLPVKGQVDSAEDVREPQRTRRGIEPSARNKINVTAMPTLNEQQKERELDTTKAGVEQWLNGTATAETDNTSLESDVVKQDMVSTAEQSARPPNVPQNPPTPGPGVYVYQEDDDEDGDSDDEDRSCPEDEDEDNATPPGRYGSDAPFPTPSEKRPMGQTIRWAQKPWVDSPFDPHSASLRDQPASSNAAIERFERRAKELETASVTATIASSRRRSLESLFSAISVVPSSRSGSIAMTRPPATQDNRHSFLDKILPKRNNSHTKKRKEGQDSDQQPSRHHENAESQGVLASSLRRVPEWVHHKQPSLTNANIHAQSHFDPPKPSPPALSPPHGPWASVTNVIRRARSKSDIEHASSLAEQWASAGGPPVANLKPSLASQDLDVTSDRREEVEAQDDEAEGDGNDDQGRTETFDMLMDPIGVPSAPTPEGFKAHILEANPRITVYLLERLTSEQTKRYRRLVENRLKHATQVDRKECSAKDRCSVLGTGPKMPESRKAGVDSETNPATFYISRAGSSSDVSKGDDAMPANFPKGIPLPPSEVQRLPAEFECPLCFQVKKIVKPSDWTKHVHEDLQPFTCSFPDCAESKSFKRKADWVRHENERHRQLERWICNRSDCQHVCYRRDNFVQHLVREHKMPEPRVRGSKSLNGQGVQDCGEVGRLAEECRYDNPRRPEDEPCRFCGNLLKTWKHLSAHLAKHMENIALPVISLVNQGELRQAPLMSPADQAFIRSGQVQDNAISNSNRPETDALSWDLEHTKIDDTNVPQQPQAQHYSRAVVPDSTTGYQGHGAFDPGSTYSMPGQHADQNYPRHVAQSYPGTSNQRASRLGGPSTVQPVGYAANDSYFGAFTETSPSETYASAFENGINILPGSQSQGGAATYPPSLSVATQQWGNSNPPSAPLYAYDQQMYNHPNFIHQPSTMEESYGFTSAPGLHGGSITSASPYSQTAPGFYSATTSPFPQPFSDLNAPAQTQAVQGDGVRQYGSSSMSQGYLSSSMVAESDMVGLSANGTRLAHPQRQQQQQQQQQQQHPQYQQPRQQQHGAY